MSAAPRKPGKVRNPAGEPCRECGMRIVFRPGPNGSTIPLQRVRALYTMDDARRRAEAFPSDPMRTYWVNHFETCPRRPDLRHRAREGDAALQNVPPGGEDT